VTFREIKNNFLKTNKNPFQAILMAFRSMGSLDKTVESCTISISDKLSKTKIELQCRNSVVKTYTLPFIECESIKVNLNKILAPDIVARKMIKYIDFNSELGLRGKM
jgi:hypothetical protein